MTLLQEGKGMGAGWGLIRHDHPVKSGWDIFVTVWIFISTLIIPYRILEGSDGIDLFYWIVTVVFLADCVVSFHTTVSLGLRVLVTRREIARHYLRTWFVPDILSALPLAALAWGVSGGLLSGTMLMKVLTGFRLLRLLQLFKMKTRFSSLQEKLNVNPGVMRLVMFAFWFILTAHFVSLGWLILGGGGREGTFAFRYLRALYWCVTTIATVGYGDITPDRSNPAQILYTIMVQLAGVGMFGYIIGNIATLIANIDVAKADFQRKMEGVKNYLRSRRIPRGLQDKVKNYYSYLWETRRSGDASAGLPDLPRSLADDIALFLNRDIIAKVPLFQLEGDLFLREVVRLLEPEIFLPGDALIRQGEFGDRMYFVNAGDVDIDVGGKIVARLGAGSFFGETALLGGEKRTATVRTLGYCDVYSLDKERFDGLRKRYPEFDRRIREIMEQRVKDTAAKTAAEPAQPPPR